MRIADIIEACADNFDVLVDATDTEAAVSNYLAPPLESPVRQQRVEPGELATAAGELPPRSLVVVTLPLPEDAGSFHEVLAAAPADSVWMALVPNVERVTGDVLEALAASHRKITYIGEARHRTRRCALVAQPVAEAADLGGRELEGLRNRLRERNEYQYAQLVIRDLRRRVDAAERARDELQGTLETERGASERTRALLDDYERVTSLLERTTSRLEAARQDQARVPELEAELKRSQDAEAKLVDNLHVLVRLVRHLQVEGAKSARAREEELHALRLQLQSTHNRLQIRESSVSYRVGNALVEAVKDPLHKAAEAPSRVLGAFRTRNASPPGQMAPPPELPPPAALELADPLPSEPDSPPNPHESLERSFYTARPAPRSAGVGVRVAGVLSLRTAAAMAPSGDLTALGANNGAYLLESRAVDLLLVETAVFEAPGPWAELGGPDYFAPEDRARALLEEARRRGIPTVLWDNHPRGFPRRFQALLDGFDWVASVDPERVPGGGRVELLPPAVQSRHYNPTLAGSKRSGVVHLGSYDRRADREALSATDAALEVCLEHDLAIYDRGSVWAGRAGSFDFPERFRKAVRPGLDLAGAQAALGTAGLALVTNPAGPGSGAYDPVVLEALMCGASVACTPTSGLGALVDAVSIGRTSEDFERIVTERLGRTTLDLDAIRRVVASQTYDRLLATLAHRLGVTTPSRRSTVAVLAELRDRASWERFAEELGRQSRRPEAVHLAVEPGLRGTVAEADLLPGHGTRVHLHERATRDESAARLRLARHVGEDLVAFWNPVNRYGPHYLEDMVSAFAYGDIDVVGKASYQVESGRGVRVEGPGLQFRYAVEIHPDTAVVRRSLLDELRGRRLSFDDPSSWSTLGCTVLSADDQSFIARRGRRGRAGGDE